MFIRQTFFGLNMRNVLFVTSSIFGEDSKSRRLALDFLQHWKKAHPAAHIVTRDTNTISHVNAQTLAASTTPAEKRNPEQVKTAAVSDALIAEVEAADTIVIGAPMYNFTISSTLKAWIDHIAIAGRTFRYTPSGPAGLLTGKKVFVVASRGGFYVEGPAKAMDFQEPYLRAMLGFLGLTDVTFIHAEGQNTQRAAEGFTQARAAIGRLLSPVRAAA
jgi:FMN-dependent NADH-azoreductase